MSVKDTRLQNLRALVEREGSTAEVGRKAETSPSYLSQILNGMLSRTKKPRSVGDALARKIERGFGLDDGWMDVPHGAALQADQTQHGNVARPALSAGERKYPLISWVQAGSWSETVDAFQPGDAEDWMGAPPGIRVSDCAFWLEVKGMSMENPRGWPSFPAGSYVLVDPAVRECVTGAFVVAKIDDTDEQTFKQLNCEGGRIHLQPLNPQYAVIEIDRESRIIGTVQAATMRL